jgi:hypothetical protein
MESKALVKALKTAVREVIKEELTDILREGLQSTVTELKTESVKKTITPPAPKRKKKTMFTRNNFSDILNETDSLRESTPSYSELMTEPAMSFNSNDAQGFGMLRGNTAPQIMEDPETGKNMKVDPVVAKALTRDYRGLMKAIDKKKGK